MCGEFVEYLTNGNRVSYVAKFSRGYFCKYKIVILSHCIVSANLFYRMYFSVIHENRKYFEFYFFNYSIS